MGNDSTLKIQSIEKLILEQVLRIIEKHNLTYFMLGGTLLGAVRHQGFIPWDDDIDIGLPRPDYETFLRVASAELPEPYQLHTLQSGLGEYSYYYARVENPRVRLMRYGSYKSVEIPVFIDVFPLDGAPSEKKEQDRWIKKCLLLKRVYHASQFSYFAAAEDIKRKRSLPNLVLRKLFLIFHLERFINTNKAWERLDNELKRYDFKQSDYLINMCGFWGAKELFPKAIYGSGRYFQFDDMQLIGPENFDYVLTQMYGDYMSPPPESEREHHYLELIEDDGNQSNK